MIGQTLRYLGIRGEADCETVRLAAECLEELKKTVNPKFIKRTFLPFEADNGLFLKGENIKRLLDGAQKVVLFAATLGIEADRAIKRYQKKDMAKAAVFDAAAAAYLENFLDSIDFSEDKLMPTMRFSPGYGDYPIEMQKVILKLLKAEKIGISLLDSFMLTPSKTVTAVLGLIPLSRF